MNRHGRHNIRIVILWAQTGHCTGTCTVSLHVIELWTHKKIRIVQKNNFRSAEIRIRICFFQKKKKRNRLYLFSAA